LLLLLLAWLLLPETAKHFSCCCFWCLTLLHARQKLLVLLLVLCAECCVSLPLLLLGKQVAGYAAGACNLPVGMTNICWYRCFKSMMRSPSRVMMSAMTASGDACCHVAPACTTSSCFRVAYCRRMCFSSLR
jgi:hypothetical protein